MLEKLITTLLLFSGESLGIYVEIIAAKNAGALGDILIKMIICMFLAVFSLVAGYVVGIKYFQNIWIVGVISITSIIIVEPIMTYLIFHEMPNRGALIGLVLGILGFIVSITVK